MSGSYTEVFQVKVRDVTFRVEKGDGEWIVTAEDDPMFFKTITKARDATKDKFVNSVTKYLEKRGYSDITPKEVHDAFYEYFVRRALARRNLSVPENKRIVFMKLPLDYNEDLGIAIALTYTVKLKNDEYVYEPVILMMGRDGELRELSITDVIRGVEIEGTNTILIISTHTYKEVEDLDLIQLEKTASDITKNLIERLRGTIPRAEDVLKWVNIIRNSGADVMKLLGEYARQKAVFIERYIWSGFPDYAKEAISLLTSIGIAAPISDFVMRTVFTSTTPGSGKSYTMGVLSAFQPYAYIIDSATAAAISRVMDGVNVIVLDDPNIDENLIKVLVHSNRKHARRSIADKESRGVIDMELGSIVFLPNLAGQLDRFDTTGALRTRSMIIYTSKDRKMVRILDMYEQMKREVINDLSLGSSTYTFRVDELYPIDVAFFLLAAGRLREMYVNLDKEVNELARGGKLDVDPRVLQVLAPLLILARVVGEDYEKAVWEYIRNMSEEHTIMLSTPYDYLYSVVDAILRDAMKGEGETEGPSLIDLIDEYSYVFRNEKPIILVRYAGLKRVVDSITKGLSERNAAYKPQEFENENAISRFIRNDVILRELVVMGRRKDERGGKYYPHFIITPDTLTVIEYVKAGRVAEARGLIACIKKKICEELSDLINDGKIQIDCSGITCQQEGQGSGDSQNASDKITEALQKQVGVFSGSHEPGQRAGSTEGVEAGSTVETVGNKEGSPTQSPTQSLTQPSTEESGGVLREVIPRSKIREVVRELLSGDGHEPTNQ